MSWQHKTTERSLGQLIADARGQVEASQTSPGPTSDAISGYELRREIHRGGQGVVYLARQQGTQRDVAIKVMREGPFAGAGDRARFEREVQLLASLKHPNIVAIHDSGNVSGNVFFVMDYIPGTAFDVWCDQQRSRSDNDTARRRPFSTRRTKHVEVLNSFLKICDALNIAHQRGVIHRDLKPGNIQVDEHGEPFVLDFGLAKMASAESDTQKGPTLTGTGQFLGTLPWASPEQVAESDYHADIRSDVYALGLILYRALTGRMPYSIGPSVAETIHSIMEVEPSKPSSLVKDIDRDLETIVLKCLSKSPDRRYQTAGALADDLRRYLECVPIDARRESGWYLMQMLARRHRLAVGFTAAFAALLVGSSVLLLFLYSRALRSERLAEQRADETRQVAEFQAAQLAELDPALMGIRLRDHLWDGVRRPSAPVSADADVNLTPELEAALANVNFTDLARQVLDENIFERALVAIDSQFPDQPLVRAELLQTIALTLKELGLFERALPPQTEALAIRQQQLSPDDPQTLQSMNHTGLLLLAMGQNEAALSCLDEALASRRRILGNEHPDTLQSIQNLGQWFQEMERYEEASIHGHEALEGRRRVLGDNNPETLSSMDNIGTLLFRTGRLNEALPSLEEALEGRRKVLGDDHADTLVSINNVAFLLQELGQLHEARMYFEEALRARRRVLGDGHPNTLNSMSNLARALFAAGLVDEAFQLTREAVEGYRRVLGKEHPHTLRSIRQLGQILIAMGRLAEAEPFLHEALDAQRRLLGDDNSQTIRSLGSMASLMESLGNLDEAMRYAQERLEALIRTSGERHPDTINARTFLARVQIPMGQDNAALDNLQMAMESSRSVHGEEHPQSLGIVYFMGRLMYSMDRLDEAESYFQQALRGFRKIAGEDHPNTLGAMISLGAVLKKMGRLEEALPYYREGLARYRDALGDEHESTLITICQLGELYLELELSDLAEACFEEALDSGRRVHGDAHPATIRAVRNMGSLLLSQGNHEAAEPLLLEAAANAEPLSGAKDLYQSAVERLVELYEERHAAKPDAGYDRQAAEWREKITPGSGSTDGDP